MTKGSDLLVAALENEGVERIFGVPGEENLDVVESLRTSTIELVLTRHEQAAAFMAATYGRLTGRPGVCIATLGPGRAELRHRRGLCASRRHADDHDHRPEGDHERAAGAVPDRRHRRDDEAADQDDAADRQRREHPDDGARRLPRRAWRSGRGRCIWSCRRTSPARRSTDVPLVPPHPIELPVAHPAALDRAAEMILQAKRPLVMIGAAGEPAAARRRPRPTSCGALRIPFFNTQMGKGAVAGRLATSTWARRRCPSATMSTRRSTAPT